MSCVHFGKIREFHNEKRLKDKDCKVGHMELFILRHGIAVERGTVGYERDSSRPLTPKGERKMYGIARGMQTLELSFDRILSSPYERAKRTAEIVAEVLKIQKALVFTDELAVGGNEVGLIEEINNQHTTLQNILLVGHEPYLSGLISLLVTGDRRLSVTLKKGALCKLNVGTLTPGQCATLEWLIAPKVMTRIQ